MLPRKTPLTYVEWLVGSTSSPEDLPQMPLTTACRMSLGAQVIAENARKGETPGVQSGQVT